jgi:hypothetical protein
VAIWLVWPECLARGLTGERSVRVALAGEVSGGAFDYDLFPGGLGRSSPNDWFLLLTLIVGPPEPMVAPEPPILPPEPPLPPGVYPIIGPEMSRPTAWSSRSPGNWG